MQHALALVQHSNLNRITDNLNLCYHNSIIMGPKVKDAKPDHDACFEIEGSCIAFTEDKRWNDIFKCISDQGGLQGKTLLIKNCKLEYFLTSTDFSAFSEIEIRDCEFGFDIYDDISKVCRTGYCDRSTRAEIFEERLGASVKVEEHRRSPSPSFLHSSSSGIAQPVALNCIKYGLRISDSSYLWSSDQDRYLDECVSIRSKAKSESGSKKLWEHVKNDMSMRFEGAEFNINDCKDRYNMIKCCYEEDKDVPCQLHLHFGVLVMDENMRHFERISVTSEKSTSESSLKAVFFPSFASPSSPSSAMSVCDMFKCLVHLDLSYNSIYVISPELYKIKSLQSLILSYNSLVTIHDTIGNLTNLTCLHLDNNKITTLPDSITSLSRLVDFKIEHNMLRMQQIANTWRKAKDLELGLLGWKANSLVNRLPIFVVGASGSGKTFVARFIKDQYEDKRLLVWDLLSITDLESVSSCFVMDAVFIVTYDVGSDGNEEDLKASRDKSQRIEARIKAIGDARVHRIGTYTNKESFLQNKNKCWVKELFPNPRFLYTGDSASSSSSINNSFSNNNINSSSNSAYFSRSSSLNSMINDNSMDSSIEILQDIESSIKHLFSLIYKRRGVNNSKDGVNMMENKDIGNYNSYNSSNSSSNLNNSSDNSNDYNYSYNYSYRECDNSRFNSSEQVESCIDNIKRLFNIHSASLSFEFPSPLSKSFSIGADMRTSDGAANLLASPRSISSPSNASSNQSTPLNKSTPTLEPFQVNTDIASESDNYFDQFVDMEDSQDFSNKPRQPAPSRHQSSSSSFNSFTVLASSASPEELHKLFITCRDIHNKLPIGTALLIFFDAIVELLNSSYLMSFDIVSCPIIKSSYPIIDDDQVATLPYDTDVLCYCRISPSMDSVSAFSIDSFNSRSNEADRGHWLVGKIRNYRRDTRLYLVVLTKNENMHKVDINEGYTIEVPLRFLQPVDSFWKAIIIVDTKWFNHFISEVTKEKKTNVCIIGGSRTRRNFSGAGTLLFKWDDFLDKFSKKKVPRFTYKDDLDLFRCLVVNRLNASYPINIEVDNNENKRGESNKNSNNNNNNCKIGGGIMDKATPNSAHKSELLLIPALIQSLGCAMPIFRRNYICIERSVLIHPSILVYPYFSKFLSHTIENSLKPINQSAFESKVWKTSFQQFIEQHSVTVNVRLLPIVRYPYYSTKNIESLHKGTKHCIVVSGFGDIRKVSKIVEIVESYQDSAAALVSKELFDLNIVLNNRDAMENPRSICFIACPICLIENQNGMMDTSKTTVLSNRDFYNVFSKQASLSLNSSLHSSSCSTSFDSSAPFSGSSLNSNNSKNSSNNSLDSTKQRLQPEIVPDIPCNVPHCNHKVLKSFVFGPRSTKPENKLNRSSFYSSKKSTDSGNTNGQLYQSLQNPTESMIKKYLCEVKSNGRSANNTAPNSSGMASSSNPIDIDERFVSSSKDRLNRWIVNLSYNMSRLNGPSNIFLAHGVLIRLKNDIVLTVLKKESMKYDKYIQIHFNDCTETVIRIHNAHSITLSSDNTCLVAIQVTDISSASSALSSLSSSPRTPSSFNLSHFDQSPSSSLSPITTATTTATIGNINKEIREENRGGGAYKNDFSFLPLPLHYIGTNAICKWNERPLILEQSVRLYYYTNNSMTIAWGRVIRTHIELVNPAVADSMVPWIAMITSDTKGIPSGTGVFNLNGVLVGILVMDIQWKSMIDLAVYTISPIPNYLFGY